MKTIFIKIYKNFQNKIKIKIYSIKKLVSMSLYCNYQSLDVKSIGSHTTVPENNIAKLMYYFYCVSVVIQLDKNNRYTDYSNYFLLSKEEEETVAGFAILFSPEIMKKYCLFVVNPQYVKYGYTNDFLEITNNNLGIHVDSEVIIGGVSRKVLKIMVCKECWLEENYYLPLSAYLLDHPDLKKKNCCESFCDFLNCFAKCFDSLCCCFNCDCTTNCKKIWCIIFYAYIITVAIICILSAK